MKKSVFCLIISIIFSNAIFSQEDLINKSEIEKLIASHLYDSVTIKGRVIDSKYSENDSIVIPYSEAILDIYYLTTFYKDIVYSCQKHKVIISHESNIDGCFEFKLARGRYVIGFYSKDSDCDTSLIYLNIGDDEIHNEEINLDDLRLKYILASISEYRVYKLYIERLYDHKNKRELTH